jgi:MFS superfamily sulfate permease-like transporter
MTAIPRTALLLCLACAGASAMLAASQFMDMFHLTPPGGEALQAVTPSDQHGYATLVLAALSLVLVIVWLLAQPPDGGRLSGRAQMAAFGVAAAGVVALLIFLTVDLPDANKIGTLDSSQRSFVDAKAEPQAGFWLELVGSMVLATCGVALATLRPPAAPLAAVDRPGAAATSGPEPSGARAPIEPSGEEREPLAGGRRPGEAAGQTGPTRWDPGES